MNPWLLVLLIIIILILLIIFIPIKYEMGFAYHEYLNMYAGVWQGYFFNVAINKNRGKSDFKLRILNILLPLSREDKPANPSKEPKTKTSSTSPLAVFRNLIHNKTYRPLGKLFGRLFQIVKPEQLQLKGQYGFYEPHYTAWAYILFLSLSSDSPNYQIQLEPVWDDEILDIEGFIKGSMTLAGITWHLIRFVLSPYFWRFLIDLFKDKKRRALKAKTRVQPQW